MSKTFVHSWYYDQAEHMSPAQRGAHDRLDRRGAQPLQEQSAGMCKMAS